ncbi:gliding motility-associated C-terminal domain-containing protein [Membranicola marinus]|uniref:Gliding motility-associated C-terminal domain-containing protein n=1 Tax=Membranihabitans marinus TaxID=1227546 RepID=A0A953HVJ3_9BACT|nr:gliding motility-associated C-terminal domain-containing protein [Membranihabitans marinus]MBY5956567.1 gliding motility-associated C-terminal domain-containing protein [Membranihabitans marinus]
MSWKWYYYISWFPFILFTFAMDAQVTCTGTFGENIFSAGDFGSGYENIVPNATGIAPGYIYTTQTPPSDGYYTITNNMARWERNYGSWINIGDNSDDPQGYMMVVNASYQPGIFYEQTIDSLCPNTTFEFSADIINVVRREVGGHSLPDLDFMIDDSVRYSTGKIPQDEQWHKHGFVFALEPGQISIKLSLVNKAPGGTGNDLALDNITFRPCGPDPDPDLAAEVYFCEDNSAQATAISTNIDTSQFYIQWQTTQTPGEDWQNTGGQNQTTIEQDVSIPGTYYYRYQVTNSAENLNNPHCISHSEVVRAEVLPLQYEIWDTICVGNERSFDGDQLTDPGSYTASFFSSHGCDSIVTLHLEVVEKVPVAFDLLVGHPLCHNSEDGQLEILNTSGGYGPYEYIVESDTNRTGRFSNLSSGIKQIGIRDHFGCVFNTEERLINPPLFDLHPFRDTQLVLGQPLTIDISATEEIHSVIAIPDILEDCTDCSRVTFIPIRSAEVVIEALNRNGCRSSETFFIEVEDDNLPIAFPNAFSPNGDGVNDDFRIIAPPHLVHRIRSARILDRWGNVVHTPADALEPGSLVLWKGNSGSVFAEPGIYAFVCELELINGEVRLFSGEVTVVR